MKYLDNFKVFESNLKEAKTSTKLEVGTDSLDHPYFFTALKKLGVSLVGKPTFEINTELIDDVKVLITKMKIDVTWS